MRVLDRQTDRQTAHDLQNMNLFSRQTDRHDRQTTHYIDNRVTAAHVRVLDRQTDTTDRLHSVKQMDNKFTHLALFPL